MCVHYKHSLYLVYIHVAYFKPPKCRAEAVHRLICWSQQLCREHNVSNLGLGTSGTKGGSGSMGGVVGVCLGEALRTKNNPVLIGRMGRAQPQGLGEQLGFHRPRAVLQMHADVRETG